MGTKLIRSNNALQSLSLAALSLTALLVQPVFAAGESGPARGCIELKTVGEVEKTVTDAAGARTTKLVPATRVPPGGEVIWTVTATNVCTKNAESVAIDNPVPEHMTYVADSAFGPGTDITFSVDGRTFAAASDLRVRDPDGQQRPARTDEYTRIRWQLKSALPAGAVAIARFRALVK